MPGELHRLGAVAFVAVAGWVGFPDPAGDVRGGAGPDLTAVSVSHDRVSVTFRLRFATAPPLRVSERERWADMVLVAVDVPPRTLRRTSLGWSGADYWAGMHAGERTATVVRAGPRARNTVVGRPPAQVSGHTVTFSVRRALLGNPAWIEVAVAAGREGGGEGSDEAPARVAFHVVLSG